MNDLNKAYKNKNVLVTGGLGFIGSNLVRRLVELGARVTIVDSLIPEYGGNLFNIAGIENRVQVNFADIRDENSMNNLVRGRDSIFNLAGQISHHDSMVNPYVDLEINCRSQLSILEACRKNNPGVKILYAGTRGQYGRTQKIPVDETHVLNPVDVNGVNKIAGENYHLVYHKVYGLRAASLRLTNTYGPRHMMKNSRQGFLNWFVRLALDGESIPIYGDGRNLRDFNYIDDVVEAFLLAGASEKVNGEYYNLGGGSPMSVLDAAKAVIEAAGSGSLRLIPFPPQKKQIEIGDYVASFEKFKKATGWQPQVELEVGLRRTVEFYRRHRDHYWTKEEPQPEPKKRHPDPERSEGEGSIQIKQKAREILHPSGSE